MVYVYKEDGQELLAGETGFRIDLDGKTWGVRVQETASGELRIVMPDDWPFAARVTAYSRVHP